jgi:hypothetical protein
MLRWGMAKKRLGTTGLGEERVKSIFIHFPFSQPSGALKCVLTAQTEFGRTN